MTSKINIKDAPILEFDTDDSSESMVDFFNNGKRGFEDFDKIKEMGIDKCVIFLPRSFEKCEEIYKKCVKIHDFKAASTISPVYLYDNKILIAKCPLGGPAAANLMEELSYNGIKHFIACGSCGCINQEIDFENDFFIPTSAIRDEGVSYHYMPASRTVETSKIVNNALINSLKKMKQPYTEGITWTIDAMYRETPNRTSRRKSEGALGVEMECASFAAVAKHNKVNFGSLLYFTDLVGSKEWNWRIYDKVKLRVLLLQICIDAILSL